MAKQTFTSGQVLTAAEMNSLQENDYNWTVTTKTASYTLAAGDEGTRVVMNNAGATTITVDDSVFAAGDVVWLHNIGAGTCTVTAGTATVSSLGELALEQYAGGHLYFTSASAAIFFPTAQSLPGKILQVVRVEKTTDFDTTSTSYVDVTGMSVTITPTSTSSAILILATFTSVHFGSIDNLRGNYAITDSSNTVVGGQGLVFVGSNNLTGTSSREFWSSTNIVTYDTPATTSATTYKLRQKTGNASTQVRVAGSTSVAQMYALEISA